MNNRHYRAPLSSGSQKFDRSYKIPEKYKIPPIVIATGLKVLYVFLLMAIDLILFTGSGNLNIFHGGYFLSSELLILLSILFLLSALLLTLSAFSKWLQNGICALATFWFVIVLFNQFSQFDNNTFLGNFLSTYFGSWVPFFFYTNSEIILAGAVALCVLWLFMEAHLIVQAIYVLLFFIAFCGILRHDYCSTRNQHDFIELYQSQIKNNADVHGNKFIYIMLPGLTSYKYLGTLQSPEAIETKQLATGFFAKNNFEVFPNAYNKSSNPFMNMVSSLNTFSADEPERHVMDTMLLYKYWKFFNVNDEYVFLKDNQMFDTFRKAGYKISAYKSRGFDLCHKNHLFNVDRCIEKLNHPVNLYSMNMTTTERTQLLFIEWLSSMKLFKNMSALYQAIKIFSEPETLPLVGINYNNLYVINSVKTFDVLAENIVKDKGRQAYFVYADIPSDMFIYDEFCKIKPRDEWVSMDDLPWVISDHTMLKQQGYLDQTKCLYGKLQELINKLKNEKLLEKSVIIINGMSGTNNFQSQPDQNFVKDMINVKLAALAIKSPASKKLKINYSICESNGILRHYLYQGAPCEGLNAINIHNVLKEELVEELFKLDMPTGKMKQNITFFDQWYKKWAEMNNILMTEQVDIIKKNAHEAKHKIWAIKPHGKETPDLKNETLQKN